MFGIELIDASLLPAIMVAVVAGLLSFLSPCVLPIVPPYLAYMSGISMGEMRLDAGDRGGSVLGAYVLGLAFAFGWTPCNGPQLGTILSIAAQDGNIGRGMVLLGFYAAGLGIPFLLVAAFFVRLTPLVNFMKRHTDRIEKIMGLLLWTIGLMMLTGGLSDFSYWILENVPFLASLG